MTVQPGPRGAEVFRFPPPPFPPPPAEIGDGDPEPPPVDEPEAVPATAAVVAEEPGTRRDIIPAAYRRHNLRATLDAHAELTWFRVRFHGIRAPGYAARWTGYALRSPARRAAQVLAWWHWVDGWVLESQAVISGRGGHADAMRAHTEGKKTRATRGKIVAVCAAGAVAGVTVMALTMPWWAWALLGLAAYPVLVLDGRPPGKPLATAAVVPAKFVEPTPEIITRALASIGLSPLTRAVAEGVQMLRTPVHRDGPGWAVRLELPEGVTAVEVIDKRDKLASALRRPLSATWPLPVSSEHPGMLELWVGFTALNKQPPVKWPLAEAGRADLFQPIPFAADQRGNIVAITLMFMSVLIGAMPRMGKTFALRVIALACALDPSTRVRVWELKGTGDLAALKHVAHEYGSGADRDTLEACLDSVRAYHGQLDPRAKALREFAEAHPALVPENKVTPAMCADRRLGLFPDILIIDEVQEAFSDPDLGAKFEALLEPVTKRGPALGMSLVLATQRPDKRSLPTSISANIGIRFCLRVMSYIASNMVLGDGMSTQGYNAADFVRSDKGIGWLTGEADDPQIVRGCYIDGPAADKIARRARAARLAAGTLTGFAAERDDEPEARDFLADVLTVFGADRNLWSETIAARLAEQLPEAYAAVTRDAVASQLRAAEVTVKDVRESGRSQRKGCERAAVVAAITARQDQP